MFVSQRLNALIGVAGATAAAGAESNGSSEAMGPGGVGVVPWRIVTVCVAVLALEPHAASAKASTSAEAVARVGR
jgi:hypothetical protein